MSDFTTSTADILADSFIEKFMLIADEPCPVCGHQMLMFKAPDGKPRCKPACPNCSYRVGVDQATAFATSNDIQVASQRKDAINYLKNSSVSTNKTVFSHTFKTFDTPDQETANMKQLALRAVGDIVSKKRTHVVFTGDTGTGKTHLAMAILNQVLETKHYVKSVRVKQGNKYVDQNRTYETVFINYRELLEQMRNGFHDEETYKQYTQLVMGEVKKADLVVVDDLGSEGELFTADDGSVHANPVSRYDAETATSLFEARVDEPTIITTNNTGQQLRELYGPRVLSRILSHSKGYAVSFKGIQDHRMKQEV